MTKPNKFKGIGIIAMFLGRRLAAEQARLRIGAVFLLFPQWFRRSPPAHVGSVAEAAIPLALAIMGLMAFAAKHLGIVSQRTC